MKGFSLWANRKKEGRMQRSGWKALFVVLLAALVGLGTGSRTIRAATSTINIDAHAYVKHSKPDRHYGLGDTVNVSSTDAPRKDYVKFTIANVSGSITHAVLRLYVG